MATLDNSLNVIACGAQGALGTGTKGCKATFREARKFLLTSQGYKFDGTQDFTDEYVKSLSASGEVIVLDGVSSVEELTTQNTYTDIGRGVEVLDNEGLYGFKIKFIKGMYNQRILNSLSGNGVYDISAIDSTGKMMGTVASDGTSAKGFTLGVHQVEMLEGILATNTAKESFKIQLTETSEMSNPAFKDVDADFNGLNVVPVNEVVLEWGVIPSDTDTSVTIKAKRFQDGKPFTGATFEQFIIKNGTTTINPTGGDDSVTAGTYVLTGITAVATSDIISAQVWDNTNQVAGIEVDGDLYKSSAITKTVVA